MGPGMEACATSERARARSAGGERGWVKSLAVLGFEAKGLFGLLGVEKELKECV